jgi:uncharacterized membrane protein YhaH (DUF805 family)
MAIDPTQEIEDLVAFEGRGPGTDAERRAAVHLERRLRDLGREAESEPTSVHPNYPLAHALHALIAIVGSVLSVTVPLAGAGLVLFAALSAFGDLTGSFYIVRRLTGRRASQNVTSVEDGDKPGVVILMAHYDAARSGALFTPRAVERRATLGKLLRRGLGPFEPFFWALLVVLACSVLRLVGIDGTAFTVVQFIPTVVLIAFVPLFVDIALSGVATGANHNASGVATVLRLAERYGGRLENFDLWVMLPGADSGLLLGSRAWMRRHRSEIDAERTIFVNVQAAGTGTPRWIEKEGPAVAMRYHPTLVELCEGIGEGRGIVSREATSALAARTAGFPAITITARNALDYAPERVDPDALEGIYEFCGALLERLDESVGSELA